MASVVLGLGAAYIGVGQSLLVQGLLTVSAAVAGSYLDNELFGEDLKPRDELDPHIPQQQIASEGGPSVYVLGTEAVVSGQVIWMSDIVDKGGGVWVADVALAFSRNPVNGVVRTFSRDLDLYELTAQETVQSQTISIEPKVFSPGGSYEEVWLREPSGGDLDLTQRKHGRANVTTLNGWKNEVNRWGFDSQWQWTPNPGGSGSAFNARVESGTNDTILELRRYNNGGPRLSVAESTTTPPTSTISITQTFDQANLSLVTSVTIHRGLAGQTADPIISTKSPSTIQAYEGIGYCVIEELKVANWGNRIPEDLQIVVDQSTIPLPVGTAIRRILEWHGLLGTIIDPASDRFDMTELDPRVVRGYGIRGNLSATKMLEPLRIAHDISAQWEWGKVRFFHPKNARIWWVSPFDFVEPLKFSDAAGTNLPSSVTVTFTDANAFRYEVGSVEEHISYQTQSSSQPVSSNVTTVDLRMLTMTEDEARAIAKRLLWRPRMESTKVTGALSARHMHIKEGDGFSVPQGDHDLVVMIDRIDRGANWELQFEGHLREGLTQGVL